MEIRQRDGTLKKVELKINSKKARTPEQEVIDAFREKINAQRVGTKYKPMSYMAVRSYFPKGISVEDMWWFYGRCKEYEDRGIGQFSRAFFGVLKIKDAKA